MRPPRRPGDDARPGRSADRRGTTGQPGGRSRAPSRPDDEAERPKKPLRVRKDGSVASGRSEDRQAKAAAPARRSADESRAPSRPRRENAPAVRTARPARVRKDDSVANGHTEDRQAKAAPARRPGSVNNAPLRPRGEGTPAARPAKPLRTRKDGSVATGSRVVREERSVTRKHEPQRIAKLLARAGIASRREIERMIAEGRIALNGTVLDTPATILTSLDGVTVDGRPVEAPEATRLFLFHKPTGFLTTERDPKGRPTIYDRLPRDLPRLMPVGRLDMNTEGLLLLTTDGEFKRKLELPSSGIPRVYRARAYGEVTQDQLEALADGIEIEGVRYGSIDANMERRTGRNMWIEVKITEGKNREVRRVLEHLGLQVSRLIRVAYGPFVLGELPSGEIGEVKQHDLVEFRKTLK